MSQLKSINELLKIKGVGFKIANLYTQIALNKTYGISVDTHCHRIANRLKWIQTNTPNETKKQLELVFERDKWHVVNKTVVGFGQSICVAGVPKCEKCPLNKLCQADENYVRKVNND